jgi:hypothetical protein
MRRSEAKKNKGARRRRDKKVSEINFLEMIDAKGNFKIYKL